MDGQITELHLIDALGYEMKRANLLCGGGNPVIKCDIVRQDCKAYLDFRSSREAQNACQLNGMNLNGARVRIEPYWVPHASASKRSRIEHNGNRQSVGSEANSITRERLIANKSQKADPGPDWMHHKRALGRENIEPSLSRNVTENVAVETSSHLDTKLNTGKADLKQPGNSMAQDETISERACSSSLVATDRSVCSQTSILKPENSTTVKSNDELVHRQLLKSKPSALGMHPSKLVDYLNSIMRDGTMCAASFDLPPEFDLQSNENKEIFLAELRYCFHKTMKQNSILRQSVNDLSTNHRQTALETNEKHEVMVAKLLEKNNQDHQREMETLRKEILAAVTINTRQKHDIGKLVEENRELNDVMKERERASIAADSTLRCDLARIVEQNRQLKIERKEVEQSSTTTNREVTALKNEIALLKDQIDEIKMTHEMELGSMQGAGLAPISVDCNIREAELERAQKSEAAMKRRWEEVEARLDRLTGTVVLQTGELMKELQARRDLEQALALERNKREKVEQELETLKASGVKLETKTEPQYDV